MLKILFWVSIGVFAVMFGLNAMITFNVGGF
jgi:hypothetical protein